MEEEPNTPEPKLPEGQEEKPPPFEPDPELVTYLERGRKDDAPEKFEKALDELEGDAS